MRRFCSALLPLFVFGLVLAGCDSGGSVPDDLGSNTSVGFVETAATVVEGEDESFDLEIVADDPGNEEVRFNLSVDQQGTASLGEDLTGLTGDTTVTFPESATSGGTRSLSLDVVDEPIDSTGFLEDTETLSLTLSPADTLAPEIDEGAAGFTLTIEEDDEPLTAEESRNRPDGSRTVTDGIVTRVESDGAYVQDDTGAFFVFDGDFASQVSRGDSVRVDGTVGYFNGVFQVSGVSSGALTETISSGNLLPSPQEISLFEVMSSGEEYESELVRISNFAIDDGGDNTFQGGVPAGLYDVSSTDTSSTLLITGASGLVGEEIPDRGTFQGVVGQFNDGGDGSDEPDEGYQLLGIDASDVIAVENLLAVDFEDGSLAPMSVFDVTNGNGWAIDSFEGNSYAGANAFGGSEASNSWLITPALNFNNFEGETLTFRNAKNFDDTGLDEPLRVQVSTDYDGSGNPENFTWTDITSRVENFSEGSFNYVSSGEIDLTDASFQANEVYVAFQYRSSGTGAGSSEEQQVDDITVSGTPNN